MNKVRRRARETEGYAGRFQRAARAYASETAKAAAALPPGANAGRRLRWRRRPDVAALADILSACEFEPRRVREKVLPLLLEWDLRATAAIDAGDAGRDLARRRDALRAEGVEFVAIRVVKAAGKQKHDPVEVSPAGGRRRSGRVGGGGDQQATRERRPRGGARVGAGGGGRWGRRRRRRRPRPDPNPNPNANPDGNARPRRPRPGTTGPRSSATWNSSRVNRGRGAYACLWFARRVRTSCAGGSSRRERSAGAGKLQRRGLRGNPKRETPARAPPRRHPPRVRCRMVSPGNGPRPNTPSSRSCPRPSRNPRGPRDGPPASRRRVDFR